MLKKIKIMTTLILVLSFLFTFSIHSVANDSQPTDTAKKNQLQQRIDFGNAYIMGQSIKSGAVYLLHRKKSDIKSMLKIRSDYRKEIIDDFSLENTKLILKEKDE
jgi:hypothetical protein